MSIYKPKDIALGVGEYFFIMFSTVASAVCGWLSFISLCVGVYKWTTDNQGSFWFWVSLAFFFLASFWVWYKDRPQLFVEKDNVFVIGYKKPNIIFVTIELLFTNTRPAKNSLKDCKLFIESNSGKLKGKPTKMPYYLDIHGNYNSMTHQSYEFLQGELRPVSLTFEFEKGSELMGKNFVLSLTDSYNATYQLKGAVPLRMVEERPGRDA
jgi:hypothetical protein